jgi:hypothetical protein
MTKYRLKKEARQFFDDKFHRYAEPMKFWTNHKIHRNLLEEVELVHIEYGHLEKADKNSQIIDLCSWENNEAVFRFILRVNEINNYKFDAVKIAELMDEMQKVVNGYFNFYLNK